MKAVTQYFRDHKGDCALRKTVFVLLGFVFAVLCYFTVISADKAFRSDWQLPRTADPHPATHRLVLITQELDTPFWNKVGAGAMDQAAEEGASLEVWGSYGKNREEFLKKIEIAIHAKVDGIIVQGLDTEEFINLTKVKAAFYGIPVITVANDVSKELSLRKTYVGSDQYLAGRMIANQLLMDMGPRGKVILLSGDGKEFYQLQRISGIQETLERYPNIEVIHAETPDTAEQVISTTRDVLNRVPEADAFIAVNANIAGAMIREISRRFRVEPYYIYSFDDSTETMALLKEGKLDGIIQQSPETMGRMSVKLMTEWLNGKAGLLDMDGYFTDIKMLKAADVE
jgi:ribose transport system substrate-binding protein